MLKIGDIDVTKDGGGRLKIAASLMQIELREVREAGVALTEKLRTKIAGLERRLGIRSEERDRKNEQRADRIEQGRLWRTRGVYEKTLHIDLPRLARTAVYVFLSGLDFYVFAEAWAIGTDSRTGEVNWWIGGLLGLVVFGAGFLAAVQLKRVVVARRQQELLAEEESPDPRFVPLAPNFLFLLLAGGFFLTMVIFGFLVRVSNEAAEANLFMVAMAALIPLLAALTELFLYDPMQRDQVRQNPIDRVLARRQARLLRKLELREERIEHALENIREKYATEIEILKVELGDRGIAHEGAGA
ncbi:MAG TPA: hypothetical protein VNP96_02750 [Solirubrobacterales bacterium]|nr:hypothetical protein [Solirubrobacterales bacterium]